jgi:GNAT superfamily N-acetyltransferase
MKVERIKPADTDTMMTLATRAFNESYYKNHKANEEFFRSVFVAAMENPLDWFAVKCVKDGEIIGFFTGCVSDMGFCDKYIGMDKGFYVKPEHRGSRAIVLMWDEFKTWCASRKAIPTILIHYGEDNTNTYNLFEKLGMVERGRLFIGADNVR